MSEWCQVLVSNCYKPKQKIKNKNKRVQILGKAKVRSNAVD